MAKKIKCCLTTPNYLPVPVCQPQAGKPCPRQAVRRAIPDSSKLTQLQRNAHIETPDNIWRSNVWVIRIHWFRIFQFDI